MIDLLSVALSYTKALDEAGEIQDGALAQMAILASKNQINLEVDEKKNKDSGMIIQYFDHHEAKDNAFISPSDLVNHSTNSFHQITVKKQP